MSFIKVAVDASRVRSGGGVAHLIGIMNINDPREFGINEIHVWAYKKLLDALPDCDWLVKHHSAVLERSLLHQSWWQGVHLSREVKQAGCDVLFSADASTFCRFKPLIVLNQNMLAYDQGVLELFGWGKDRVQQSLMYFVQRQAFRFSAATIFLTRHAAEQVQRRVGKLNRTTRIPHGVADLFKDTAGTAVWPERNERPIRCLYVSPIFEYKHQNEVVLAVRALRDQGINIELVLAGGGGRRALKRLIDLLEVEDPSGTFVEIKEFVPNDQIASMIAEADLFVFASSCETFGIALLEAMAVGVPIACSNRSSLPETLQDAGEYFDPEDPKAIEQAISRLIEDPARRAMLRTRARELAAQYSWPRCASETWKFIVQTYRELSLKGL
jgi:glycosyltransferase involved in cell wall biosynthesis